MTTTALIDKAPPEFTTHILTAPSFRYLRMTGGKTFPRWMIWDAECSQWESPSSGAADTIKYYEGHIIRIVSDDAVKAENSKIRNLESAADFARGESARWQEVAGHWLGAESPSDLAAVLKSRQDSGAAQFDSFKRLREGVQAITGFIRDSEWADLLTTDPVLFELDGEVRRLCAENAELQKWRQMVRDLTAPDIGLDAARKMISEAFASSTAHNDECMAWEKLAMEYTGTDGINSARAELSAMREQARQHKESDYWRSQYNGAMQHVRQVERDNETLSFRANSEAHNVQQWRNRYNKLVDSMATVEAARATTMTITIDRAVDAGLLSSDAMSLTEVINYLTMDVDLDSWGQRNAETLCKRIQWLRDRNEGKRDASQA